MFLQYETPKKHQLFFFSNFQFLKTDSDRSDRTESNELLFIDVRSEEGLQNGLQKFTNLTCISKKNFFFEI